MSSEEYEERLKEGQSRRTAQADGEMDLGIWLPGLFVLGLISMALCVAFAEGCAKI